MWVRVTRGTLHLGYAYREGSTGNLPEHIAKDMIRHNCAVPIPPPKVEKAEEETEPIVKTAVVKKSSKRPVKKKDEV